MKWAVTSPTEAYTRINTLIFKVLQDFYKAIFQGSIISKKKKKSRCNVLIHFIVLKKWDPEGLAWGISFKPPISSFPSLAVPTPHPFPVYFSPSHPLGNLHLSALPSSVFPSSLPWQPPSGKTMPKLCSANHQA